MTYNGHDYEVTTAANGDDVTVTIGRDELSYSIGVSQTGYLDIVGGVEAYCQLTGFEDAETFWNPPVADQ